MNRVIISIGSNIKPEENIRLVLQLLRQTSVVLKVSNIVRTKAIGMENQPDFLNGAALIETERSKDEFNFYLKNLEDRLGRDRSLPKFGPRTIDLDIVVWNGEVVDDDYNTRDFLRAAVAELDFGI